MKNSIFSFCLYLLFSCISNPVSSQNLTVRQIIDSIHKSLSIEIFPGSVDSIKSGSWDQMVTGIATTFMPTVDVIRQAAAEGIHLILAHEPSYYNHWDLIDEFGPDDPVVLAKRKLLKETGITIYRFHDIPHRVPVDMIKKGMMEKLGWGKRQLGDMVFSSPVSTLAELAEWLKDHFGSSTIRVVGDGNQKISRIAFLPGAYGRNMQVKAYQNSGDIDVLLVGEAAEWETVEYVRDALAMGWKTSLIVMGHADSEEGGMEYVRDYLKELFPGMKIMQINAHNPLWSPR